MATKKLEPRKGHQRKSWEEKLESSLEYLNLQRQAYELATSNKTKNWFEEELADFWWRAFPSKELSTGLKSARRIDEENKWLSQGKKLSSCVAPTADHAYTRKRAARDFLSIPIKDFSLTKENLEFFLREKLFTISVTSDENQWIRKHLERTREANNWIEAYAMAGIKVYEWRAIRSRCRGCPIVKIEKVKELTESELRQFAF